MGNLEIFLKSGHTIVIECESWEFKYNELGDYTGYDIRGLSKPKQFGIAINQIAGYISY